MRKFISQHTMRSQSPVEHEAPETGVPEGLKRETGLCHASVICDFGVGSANHSGQDIAWRWSCVERRCGSGRGISASSDRIQQGRQSISSRAAAHRRLKIKASTTLRSTLRINDNDESRDATSRC